MLKCYVVASSIDFLIFMQAPGYVRRPPVLGETIFLLIEQVSDFKYLAIRGFLSPRHGASPGLRMGPPDMEVSCEYIE